MKFSEIESQQKLKTQLISAVKSNRLPHAFILLGPEGNGALAHALAFSQYLMCENKSDKDSCGLCIPCIKVSKYIHPDVHYTFPTAGSKEVSKNFLELWRSTLLKNPYLTFIQWMELQGKENSQGNITADECRNIISNLSLKAFEGKLKIQIIWYADLLVKNGNRLLKIIEEPPEETQFILIAKDSEKLLKTIQSRAPIFRIPSYSSEQINQYLINKGTEPIKAKNIALQAHGNINIANNLNQEKENPHDSEIQYWFRLCYKNDKSELLKWADGTSKKGRENIKHFLKYSLTILEKCLNTKYNPSLSAMDNDFITNFAKILDINKIANLFEEINGAIYGIERNGNTKLVLFDLSLNMIKNIK